MKDIKEYTEIRGPSTPRIRLLDAHDPRFKKLQQRLTIAAEGIPLSQSQVMAFLLDCGEEKLEELLKGKTEENHA